MGWSWRPGGLWRGGSRQGLLLVPRRGHRGASGDAAVLVAARAVHPRPGGHPDAAGAGERLHHPARVSRAPRPPRPPRRIRLAGLWLEELAALRASDRIAASLSVFARG